MDSEAAADRSGTGAGGASASGSEVRSSPQESPAAPEMAVPDTSAPEVAVDAEAGGSDPDQDAAPASPPLPAEDYAAMCEAAFAAGNACGASGLDQECDGVRYQCADDERFDLPPGEACPRCMPAADAPAWPSLQSFVGAVIYHGCQTRCSDDGDCFGWRLESACGTCEAGLTGGTDEEVILAVDFHAAEGCEDATWVRSEREYRCVNGACVP